MKLPFSFKNIEEKRDDWQLLSCVQPKSLSFRESDELIKNIDSVYFNASDNIEARETWFTTSSDEMSLSARSEGLSNEYEESCEVVLHEVLLAERLFFDPEESRSILKQEKAQLFPIEDTVAMALESKDPYVDFKMSMEEMVETHGLKELECLDELLGWYLRMNVKKNHGFIVGAFVDLLVGIVSTPCTSSCSDSFASCSSSPSSHLSPFLGEESTV